VWAERVFIRAKNSKYMKFKDFIVGDMPVLLAGGGLRAMPHSLNFTQAQRMVLLGRELSQGFSG
jgi:hypothetical protein|tara:strand:- start:221 stop:412 length:192 start_codon:yes stop_codon:yes gene_type:complete